MEAILFALVAYFSWAVGDIILVIASRKTNPFTTTFWSSVVSIIFLGLSSLFFLNNLPTFSLEIIVICLLIGVVFIIGFLSFIKALMIGNAALVGTIVGSYGVITVLLSQALFRERISQPQVMAIILIFIGIVLSTFPFRDLWRRKIDLTKGVGYALITMISFGIWGAFIKIPIQKIGWFWPLFIMFLLFPPVLFIIAKIKKEKIQSPRNTSFLTPLASSAILARVGELSFNAAVSKGLVAVVVPIATSYPTLFAILAFIVFKDKFTRQQLLGVITTLIGIVFLSIMSN